MLNFRVVRRPPAWPSRSSHCHGRGATLVKPVAQWTEEDAKQVLTASPWAREVSAGIARRQTEDELRDGGEMGQHHGVGYDGVDPKGSGPKLPAVPLDQ